MAGYSGTPLVQKLGIKPTSKVLLVNKPSDVELSASGPTKGEYDVIVTFVKSLKALEKGFAGWQSRMSSAGGLWIAWPKKSSGVPTDLNDNVVREFGLSTGLVDNKVCAVDDTWSALRFVRRVKDR